MGLLLSLSCYLAVFNQVDKLYSFGMVACLILIVASKSTFPGSALGRVSVFVGEASYTTYLVHLLPLGYIITIIRGYDLHGANADLVIAISTIAITAMSCILYVLIEKNIVALTADLFRNTETIIDDAKKA
jgi:peptidoglycan/LPS O-acetylase OafA/YrhL